MEILTPTRALLLHARQLEYPDVHATPEYQAGRTAALLGLSGAGAGCKLADVQVSYGLTGTLYGSKSGWVLLTVPNALGTGVFDALQEQGVELPTKHEGRYNAHITVFRKEELDRIGGMDKITERGHQFRYTLGPLTVIDNPKGWDEVSRVWAIQVRSPELQRLRKSYGLSGLPNGDHEFHITVAIRKKGVLQANAVAKGV